MSCNPMALSPTLGERHREGFAVYSFQQIMPTPTKKFNFAAAYAELEKISAWFERENIDLEEGIEKFEVGAKLVKELKNYLNTVGNKIKELKT